MIEKNWLRVPRFKLYDANLCRSQNYLGTIWWPDVYISLNIDGTVLGPMVAWNFQESNSDSKALLLSWGNWESSFFHFPHLFNLWSVHGKNWSQRRSLSSLILYMYLLMRKCITAWGFYCTSCHHRKDYNIILSSEFTAAVGVLAINLIIIMTMHTVISGFFWGLWFIFGVLQFYCGESWNCQDS